MATNATAYDTSKYNTNPKYWHTLPRAVRAQLEAERARGDAHAHAAQPARDPRRAQKATKAADLAVSAFAIGSKEEAYHAANIAGQMTYLAGYTIADLRASCPGLYANLDLWTAAKCGYHTASISPRS